MGILGAVLRPVTYWAWCDGRGGRLDGRRRLGGSKKYTKGRKDKKNMPFLQGSPSQGGVFLSLEPTINNQQSTGSLFLGKGSNKGETWLGIVLYPSIVWGRARRARTEGPTHKTRMQLFPILVDFASNNNNINNGQNRLSQAWRWRWAWDWFGIWRFGRRWGQAKWEKEGERGVHSERVYRGYIWPLVLVNGGWGLICLSWPCFCVC
jgi:hypothetical protein